MTKFVIVLNFITTLVSISALILDIIHNSDLHSSFDPICTSVHECYGGLTQHASKIEYLRYKVDNDSKDDRYLLFLNIGDSSNGSLLYTLFRNELLAKVLNNLRPNIMTLGDAEFIVGTNELKKLLENLDENIEIVSSNLNFNQESELSKIVKKYTQLEYGINFKIGIVGYLTAKITNYLDLGNVTVLDELESVKEAVKILKDNYECDYIIALSHSTIEKDMEIATKVPDVDLIVGGHIHENYNASEQFLKKIFRKNGKPFALISRTYQKSRFIGHVILNFTDNKLVAYESERIAVDKVYRENLKMDALLEKYTRKMIDIDEEDNLKSEIQISGSVENCKTNECEIGGVVADSFVAYFNEILNISNIDGAVLDVSQFHHDLDTRLTTIVRVARCLPYLNKIYLIQISGKTVRKLFKMAALKYYDWHFLQVSNNIQVTYKKIKLALSLEQIMINGTKIVAEKQYRLLVMRHFIFDKVLRKNRNDTVLLVTSDKFDYEIVWWYLKHGRSNLLSHNITGEYTHKRVIISKSTENLLIFQIFLISIIVTIF